MEREAIKTLKEDNTCVVLTADKGVAMVVMDRSSYIDKCMALLQDTNVCSSPELLAEEMDHLGKVLKYNNYPKWMID